MANFYDQWLAFWDDEQAERAGARKLINEEDLEWVRTKQDYRAALLSSRQNGFVTAGEVMLGEILPGWHTGKHSHGEEAIYIIEGEGFSVVDGLKYDWDAGSTLLMPYGSVHQHFNSGKKTVRYLSAMSLALERFAGLAKIMQYEEYGETGMGQPEGAKAAASDIHPQYGRIVLKSKDTPVVDGKTAMHHQSQKKDEFTLSMPEQMRSAHGPGHHSKIIELMTLPDFGFKPREVEFTHIFFDVPGGYSGKHSHMEAMLYVLEGEGYSIVDGEKIPWKKGTLVQVQGPQTVHQHFTTGKGESKYLRIHFGLRSQIFQVTAQRSFPYIHFTDSAYK